MRGMVGAVQYIQYIALLDQDAGKLLLCRAVDQQTGEGGKEDGWKLNINCKFPLRVLGIYLHSFQWHRP
jgi:hypothetical protein